MMSLFRVPSVDKSNTNSPIFVVLVLFELTTNNFISLNNTKIIRARLLYKIMCEQEITNKQNGLSYLDVLEGERLF